MAEKYKIEYSSPGESKKMKFRLAELDGISGCPVYSVDYKIQSGILSMESLAKSGSLLV